MTRLRILALVSGPVVAFVLYLVTPESYPGTSGEVVVLGAAGRVSAGLAGWMAVWWLTEATPLPVTALLPLAVLPVSGAVGIDQAASPYADPLIFLFMGGFILALGMERSGLHRRFALATLRVVGRKPANVVGGFMLVTALLSMWVSNTATTMMMLPIAGSVLSLLDTKQRNNRLAVCLFLGIAYAASIGGIGTLVGTPPNLFLATFARSRLGQEISFSSWLGIGLPFVALFLPLSWLLLTKFLHPVGRAEIPGAAELILAKHAELGPMSRDEKATLAVFLLTASLWVFRPLLAQVHLAGIAPFSHLTDTGIALLAAVALFVIPGQDGPLMDWSTASRLPWGILLLFGGGLSLASALDETNVAALLGALASSLHAVPGPVIVLLVTAMVVFLTELTSNTATATTLLPILAGAAAGVGIPPLLLAAPAAIAASCAFMMPVATPPNAIVFGTNRVSIRQMAMAGLWLNFTATALIFAVTYVLVRPMFGI